MNQSHSGIQRMLQGRRLEAVEPDQRHALAMLTTAEQHIKTAHMIATTDDQVMAFTAAYDAARKALAAVLAAEGLRVRPVGGAHRNTGLAAKCFVLDDALDDFEWMRTIRNSTEYPDDDRPVATSQDVDEAIPAATAILAACSQHVRNK